MFHRPRVQSFLMSTLLFFVAYVGLYSALAVPGQTASYGDVALMAVAAYLSAVAALRTER